MAKTIYLKIGGSLLTDKKKKPSVRRDVLERVCSEISEVFRSQEIKLIIGHGGGAHAHQPAILHKVGGGKKESTLIGVKETYKGLGELHSEVLTMLMKYDLPVISFPPRAWNVMKDEEPESFFKGIV